MKIRTRGMYKKAAELSRLENDARVTVLVSSGGFWTGYIGHGPKEWPEFYQLLTTHAIAITTLDDLETVSQRKESMALAQREQISVSQRLQLLEKELHALSEARLSSIAQEANNSLAAGELRLPAQVSAGAAICDLTQDLPDTSTHSSSSDVIERSDCSSSAVVPQVLKTINKMKGKQAGKHYSRRGRRYG